MHRTTLQPPNPDPAELSHAAAPTREKLLEAATQVFAERGFYKATIREICRLAGANVAAVNYTFGDKLALYTEVLRETVRASELVKLTATLDAARSPEELLRNVIHVRLKSLWAGHRPDWGFRIIMHELSQPTPAISRVIEEGMRPIYNRVLKAVGEMLGLPPNHEKTRLCNNSIFGQILFYTFSQPVLPHLQPELKLTPQQLDRIATHITDFSLAYLREMRQAAQKKTALRRPGEITNRIDGASRRRHGKQQTTRTAPHRRTSGAQHHE